MKVYPVFLELSANDGWCMVHCPHLPGVGYKAPSRQAALAVLPARLAAELAWAESAGIVVPRAATEPAYEIADEVTLDVPVSAGDTEATFEPDLAPVGDADLAYALAYVEASRRTLSDLIERLGPDLADWRPSEGKRTIAEILGHLSDAEAFYAVRLEDPAALGGPQAAADLWKHYAGPDLGLSPIERMARTRELVLGRLGRLSDQDRERVIEVRGETWSARKVLRRLPWHERYHTRQIEGWLTL